MKLKLLCIAFFTLILCSGCIKNNDEKTVNATVVISHEETVLLSETITTSAKTVEDAIIEACQKQKIPYTLKENMFDNFGGIASTKTDGWILYINTEVANAGAKFIKLEDNCRIEFKYVNYDKVFGGGN